MIFSCRCMFVEYRQQVFLCIVMGKHSEIHMSVIKSLSSWLCNKSMLGFACSVDDKQCLCYLTVLTESELLKHGNMKLKDPPADMEVPREIEIRLSNIDSEKLGIYTSVLAARLCSYIFISASYWMMFLFLGEWNCIVSDDRAVLYKNAFVTDKMCAKIFLTNFTIFLRRNT